MRWPVRELNRSIRRLEGDENWGCRSQDMYGAFTKGEVALCGWRGYGVWQISRSRE